MKRVQTKLFEPLEDQPPVDLPADARLVPWQPGFLPAASAKRWDDQRRDERSTDNLQGSNSKRS